MAVPIIHGKINKIMISINSQIIEKNGKKEFAVLPYEDFLKLQEELACYDDLRILRGAKKEEQDVSSVSLSEAKKLLKIE
jgi:PHD/YefM family antitoxin component YafN of YafNO toxin-antitoxin module